MEKGKYILKIEDPTKLTVDKLKEILTKEDVELPPNKQPKSVYVQLFNDHKARLVEAKRRQEEEAQQAPNTPPRKRKLRY